MTGKRMVIFSNAISRRLAEKICSRLSVPHGEALVRRFNDGEVRVQLEQEVRGADVFIVGSLCSPMENMMEVVLLAAAARESSAGRVTLVVPYLGYNRQDHLEDDKREPLSAQIFIQMLCVCCPQRAILFDVHSRATIGYFPGVVRDHLYASPVAVPYLSRTLATPYVFASPDEGGVKRARFYANRCGGQDLALFSKYRPQPGEIDKSQIRISGDVSGREVVFVDDIADTAKTLEANIEAAVNAGARSTRAFVTHALLSSGALARLDGSKLEELVITDTVPHTAEELTTRRLKVTVLSVAKLLAEAIRRTHDDESLRALAKPGVSFLDE